MKIVKFRVQSAFTEQLVQELEIKMGVWFN